jgi:hypothetical protein
MASELYESWAVTAMVGISTTHLNMLLQRKLYGITASVVGRRGDKNSRRFDEVEVFGIGLVWMLFNCGLRTEPIRQILADIAEKKDASAADAASVLTGSKLPYLVVVRDLTDDAESGGEFVVKGAVRIAEIEEIITETPTSSVLVIPVGEMFDGIEQRMDAVHKILQRIN